MKTLDARHEAIIDFLNENQEFVTLVKFSEAIGIDNTQLSNAVKRKPQRSGSPVTIAERFWPAAEAEILKLKERFKKAAQCP